MLYHSQGGSVVYGVGSWWPGIPFPLYSEHHTKIRVQECRLYMVLEVCDSIFFYSYSANYIGNERMF